MVSVSPAFYIRNESNWLALGIACICEGSQVYVSIKGQCPYQKWRVDKETATIRSSVKDLCLDIGSNGQLVVNAYVEFRDSQRWIPKGNYIANPAYSMVLQPCGSYVGARVAQVPPSNEESQQWTFPPAMLSEEAEELVDSKDRKNE